MGLTDIIKRAFTGEPETGLTRQQGEDLLTQIANRVEAAGGKSVSVDVRESKDGIFGAFSQVNERNPSMFVHLARGEGSNLVKAVICDDRNVQDSQRGWYRLVSPDHRDMLVEDASGKLQTTLANNTDIRQKVEGFFAPGRN